MAAINKSPSIPRAESPVLLENGAFTPEWYRFQAAKINAITDITTADATDLATAITLTNANKAKINQLLQALRDSGILRV